MSLDQFASGVSTKQSHPRGEFVGSVDSVKKVTTKKGTNLITIKVKTQRGYAPDYNLSLISEEDYQKAKFLSEQGDNKPLDKITTAISMTKQFLVKMGLVHKDVVDSLGYSQCLKELPKLIGKQVKVNVVEQKNNPDFDQSLLSKFDEQVANKNTPSNGFSVDDVPF